MAFELMVCVHEGAMLKVRIFARWSVGPTGYPSGPTTPILRLSYEFGCWNHERVNPRLRCNASFCKSGSFYVSREQHAQIIACCAVSTRFGMNWAIPFCTNKRNPFEVSRYFGNASQRKPAVLT